MTLGERIASHRRALGISQEELGARLGVSRQAVSKWETSAAVPDMENLLALSREFGYSREHLSRILGRYLSEGWNGYVNRLRARRAEEMLSERPGENVLKIAYECGFESPNTFYRAYRREFGKSPRRSN